ncbi:MAG: hypothetical protein CMJ17_09825 [Phenylobacterium sp.]|nr:hypothetical protein [Phenylobacterium sp.]
MLIVLILIGTIGLITGLEKTQAKRFMLKKMSQLTLEFGTHGVKIQLQVKQSQQNFIILKQICIQEKQLFQMKI